MIDLKRKPGKKKRKPEKENLTKGEKKMKKEVNLNFRISKFRNY